MKNQTETSKHFVASKISHVFGINLFQMYSKCYNSYLKKETICSTAILYLDNE